MIALLEPLAASVGTTNMLVPLVLSDLSDEQAHTRTRDGAGPSITWEMGHLIDYRCAMLKLLGAEREKPFAIDFGTSSATDGSDYPGVEDVRRVWGELQTALQTALENATEEAVRQPSGQGGPHGEQSVLDGLVFLTWHEAYHMGALGAIRKSLGLPGPAELVMAARGQEA